MEIDSKCKNSLAHINTLKAKRKNLVELLLDPQNGFYVFLTAVLFFYCIIPFGISLAYQNGFFFEQLSAITLLASFFMFIGYKITLFDGRFKPDALRFSIPSGVYVSVTWIVFLLFLVVTFTTAPSIPFLSAVTAAGEVDLSQERGEFLKGRDGIGIALLYLSTFLVNTVVPYSIVLLYYQRSRFRHVAAMIFFLFCISFLQKSLFLNLILPLIAFLAISYKLRSSAFIILGIGSIVFLLLLTIFLLSNELDQFVPSAAPYFSSQFLPGEPFKYFAWRALAVPIFTAADALTLFNTYFNAEPFLGATSTLISSILGLDRINFERYVFEFQFGSWNEIANANAVFITDGFVNFGWTGVIVFGLIVGQIFRWLKLTSDIPLSCLWPLFAFILFSGPLIGMLLSNGWLYIILHALFIRVPARGYL